MRKTFSILSLAALWALSSVSANAAAIVDGVGDTFTVNFNGSDDNITTSVDPWLTSSALFLVQTYSTNSLTLKVTVNNMTQSPYASRVTGMAFDLNPEATSADVTGIFTTDIIGGSFQPHGIGDTFDVCVKNGAPNNCHGSSGGVSQGTSGDFYLTLNFASSIASGVSFSSFAVRYQGIEYPQGQSGSGSGAGLGCVVGVDAHRRRAPSASSRTSPSRHPWRCSAWACSALAWWLAASGKLPLGAAPQPARLQTTRSGAVWGLSHWAS